METTKNSQRRSITQFRGKRGNRLSQLRHALSDEGVSLTELAKRCNLSRQSISLRFSIDDCKMSDMEQMAEALGYEFTWSLKRKEEE